MPKGYRSTPKHMVEIIGMQQTHDQLNYAEGWNPEYTKRPLLNYERECPQSSVSHDNLALDLGDAHMFNPRVVTLEEETVCDVSDSQAGTTPPDSPAPAQGTSFMRDLRPR